jgi:insulysin
MQQKSYFFINQLLGHEGKGSLYQSLKQLNLVEELCTEELSGYKTILDLISVEITLTLEGMQRYQEVLQLVHEYLAKVIEWTANDLAVFEESKQMATLSF